MEFAGVAQRDHEAQVDIDQLVDPHSLLFGDDDPTADFTADFGAGPGEPGAYPAGRPSSGARHSRVDPAPNRRRRRRGKSALWILSIVGVVLVVVSAWLIVPKITALVHPPDYSGSGSGSVRVSIKQGDTASDIAAALHKAGVVKSDKAFINAASDNSAAQGIQPGTYTLRAHMSAASALKLMLDPSSRSSNDDVLVTEGATTMDVEERLVKVLGADKRDAIAKALADVDALGIPLGYAPAVGKLRSVEGFLYPATYSIDPTSSPSDALQKMTTRFADADRSSGFAAKAEKLGITPYQALTIASIAQSEAKYPDDMAKVARVILNRLATDTPLKIDATTRYGALVKGVDPDTITYATFPSPYNSYTHTGLPPTPISNPGAQALNAAVHPAKGDWLFYVNSDAAGHLYFTADENDFAAAVTKCRNHNWGCG
jgi:UPF0755 protein